MEYGSRKAKLPPQLANTQTHSHPSFSLYLSYSHRIFISHNFCRPSHFHFKLVIISMEKLMMLQIMMWDQFHLQSINLDTHVVRNNIASLTLALKLTPQSKDCKKILILLIKRYQIFTITLFKAITQTLKLVVKEIQLLIY